MVICRISRAWEWKRRAALIVDAQVSEPEPSSSSSTTSVRGRAKVVIFLCFHRQDRLPAASSVVELVRLHRRPPRDLLIPFPLLPYSISCSSLHPLLFLGASVRHGCELTLELLLLSSASPSAHVHLHGSTPSSTHLQRSTPLARSATRSWSAPL